MHSGSAFLTSVCRFLIFPYFLAFLGVVGLGWYLSLATIHNDANPTLLAAIAVVVVLLVAFFSRHTAVRLLRHRLGLGPLLPALFGLVVLLGVSAFGVISSFLQLVDGPSIVRSDVVAAIEHTSRFAGRAPDWLRVPQYETLRATILPLRDQLTREILNVSGDRNCGVGTYAKATLSRIQTQLPSVALIRGTDTIHDCTDVPKLKSIAAQYEQAIDSALDSHAVTVSNRIAERNTVLPRIRSTLESELANLHQLQQNLAGVDTFIRNYGMFTSAATTLREAGATYADVYQRILSVADRPDPQVSPRLPSPQAEQLASFGGFVNILMNRLFSPESSVRTAFWIVIAIAADVLAVALLFGVAAHVYYSASVALRIHHQRRLGGDEVTYLWHPVRLPES